MTCQSSIGCYSEPVNANQVSQSNSRCNHHGSLRSPRKRKRQIRECCFAVAKKENDGAVLKDYDGRLWALCYPEKEEDIVPGRTNVALTFWVDNKWTRPLPFHFIDTRSDKKGIDSVIEVRTNRYFKHFESA